MAREDEEKTAFYTEQGTYCYMKMPFGLKNAGATYQRLVDSTFQSQIGRNLEAYVDDMVIKSKDEKDLLADIAETFENLKAINMKLNPKKCSFGSPKALPFFNTLKNITKENKHEYRWTSEAEEAFQQMKRLIISLPSLTPPPLRKRTSMHDLAVAKRRILSSTDDRPKRKTMPGPAKSWQYLPVRRRSEGEDRRGILSECPNTDRESIQSPPPREIQVEVLNEHSTDAKDVQTIVEEEGENWMTPIIKYLEEGIAPSDKNEARFSLPRIIVHRQWSSYLNPSDGGDQDRQGGKEPLAWNERLPKVLRARQDLTSSIARRHPFIMTMEVKSVNPPLEKGIPSIEP
ncbi:reverse transcriptase domain-containing protein [Tanacetum coccineum]